MKKKISTFALILLLALSLCTPALAATEYGVIYDETDELGSADADHARAKRPSRSFRKNWVSTCGWMC